MKSILVTGGAGFIGSKLCLALLKRGYAVKVLDCLLSQVHGNNPDETSPLYNSIKNKVEFIKGNVTSRRDMVNAIEDIDCVVHLAAETGTGQSMYEIEKYVSTNILGTAILLDILTNTKTTVKRVLVAESRAIYGEGRYFSDELNSFVYPEQRSNSDMRNGDFEVKYPGCKQNLTLVSTPESSLLHPTSVYGITKQVEGQLVHTICPAIGIEDVSVRYQNVYGPGQSLSNPYTGILSIFSTRIKNGNGINVFEDGKETRDFVYIDDVVDATILCIEKSEAVGRSFNIGSGIATDVFTIAKTLVANYHINVPIKITGNYRIGDIRHNYADISLAHDLLGFKPKWSFEDGIHEFCKWVDNQEIKEDNYNKSISEMKSKGLYR